MSDHDSSLYVGLNQTLVALSMGVVVDESEVLVLSRGILDTEVRDLGAWHRRERVRYDIPSVLLGFGWRGEAGDKRCDQGKEMHVEDGQAAMSHKTLCGGNDEQEGPKA